MSLLGWHWLYWYVHLEWHIDHTDVLFGFSGENKIFNVINFCIFIVNYYIYIQKVMNNNKIYFYDYPVWIYLVILSLGTNKYM